VDRIGVDLERLGKAVRQRGRATWLSSHVESDLTAVGAAIRSAHLFARVDPLNPASSRQVDAVIERGARVVMLPMVASPSEAERFVALVNGRAHVVLLVEQRSALEVLPALASVGGIREIHIGLNDLALSLGLANRWLLFALGVIDRAADAARRAGVRFGLGGLARVDDTTLPMPSDLVYAQYARTGATAALVSRSFHVSPTLDVRVEIARSRARLAAWRTASPSDIEEAHQALSARARMLDVW
jgi:hypothetical protein